MRNDVAIYDYTLKPTDDIITVKKKNKQNSWPDARPASHNPRGSGTNKRGKIRYNVKAERQRLSVM